MESRGLSSFAVVSYINSCETELVDTSKEQREIQLQQWVNSQLAELLDIDSVNSPLQKASDDASFRRYFRVIVNDLSYFAVDAPPEHENNKQFVHVAQLLAAAKVRVPQVFAADFESGFMLLEDFGDDTYLPFLLSLQTSKNMEAADIAYKKIIDSLISIQAQGKKEQLDPYDRTELRREMNLFAEWFCQGMLEMDLGESEIELISDALGFLEDSALSQSTVLVHRDYHSRNLMLLARGEQPGIIDFQDAVLGPYTYDLVSLLRDCYISWDPQQVDQWAQYYYEHANAAGVAVPASIDQFARDLDLMGLQRNLKVLGIFSRLAIRDKKSRYLADIPLVIHYFMEISSRYSEMSVFRDWFQQTVLPLAQERIPFD